MIRPDEKKHKLISKMCMLEENKVCDNCCECYICSINSSKLCDNCGKCLESTDYSIVLTDDVLWAPEETIKGKQ